MSQRLNIILIKDAEESTEIGKASIELVPLVDLASYKKPIRTSPIFSLCKNGAWIPAFNGAFKILFLSLSAPVSSLAAIPPEQRSKAWFSLGVASVIIISDHPRDLEVVQKALQPDVVALEVWDIDHGRILDSRHEHLRNGLLTDLPLNLLITSPPNLPGDIQAIVEELNFNLHECSLRSGGVIISSACA